MIIVKTATSSSYEYEELVAVFFCYHGNTFLFFLLSEQVVV